MCVCVCVCDRHTNALIFDVSANGLDCRTFAVTLLSACLFVLASRNPNVYDVLFLFFFYGLEITAKRSCK